MTTKIVVVEDDDALRQLLTYNLGKEGFEVVAVMDGAEALPTITDEAPDLIVLDWMLPNMSGIEICRALRASAANRNTPVIMLTARGEEEDKIRGLDVGADDYLTKPFSMAELVARMKAVLRRANPTAGDDQLIFQDIVLDRTSMRVTRGDNDISVGPTEFRLLELLMKRPGRVYSREQLLDQVWGREVYVENRTVDVHVGRLRKALKINGVDDPIRTVRATGYAMDETYRAK